jgi:hypothetical protein
MLGLSVLATLAANVAYGAAYGVTGALISGWPAVAFIGCAEMAITMARRARESARAGEAAPGLPVLVPSDSVAAAETSLRATLAAGNPLSVNQLAERFSLTRATATKVRTAVLAESNGHNPE